ncbi:transporter substrate-binding domain-containing protein [Frigidibacter sp. ROC022]|uniref:transporter substrate-binding domain-containing protein n=1 Tax=Frigidibacter sp. ROC022 TaxID=2971796 RepID=UPI00215B4E65|nr:transporter substrate-binding domain-containing protein [Frigidibacter sp. ROC022]MCR8725587.1 transporter substrate-binding domain-containing protein [Frigidibacter sp. ROC022]
MKHLLIAAALSVAATACQAQTVRIGTEGAFPPYSFIDDSGEIAGFEKDLGDRLCEMTGLTCVWVTNDWDSIITNLVSGNYDLILAGMTISDEREAIIDFSEPYLPPAPSAFVALDPDADTATGLIAAQAGTVHASYVAETDAVLLEFATPDEAVAAVRNGEVDAAIADKDYLAPLVAESGGELVFVGKELPLGKGMGIGFRKTDSELRATFDEGLARMKADGSINELIVKWFGPDAQTW